MEDNKDTGNRDHEKTIEEDMKETWNISMLNFLLIPPFLVLPIKIYWYLVRIYTTGCSVDCSVMWRDAVSLIWLPPGWLAGWLGSMLSFITKVRDELSVRTESNIHSQGRRDPHNLCGLSFIRMLIAQWKPNCTKSHLQDFSPPLPRVWRTGWYLSVMRYWDINLHHHMP